MTHQPPDPSVPAPLSAEVAEHVEFVQPADLAAYYEMEPYHRCKKCNEPWPCLVVRLAERQARAADPREEGLLNRLADVSVGSTSGITEQRVERIVRDADYALRKLEEGDTGNAIAALRRGFQRAPVELRAATPARAAAPAPDSEPCPYCNGVGCLPCRGRGTVGPMFRANRGLPPYRAAAEPAGLRNALAKLPRRSIRWNPDDSEETEVILLGWAQSVAEPAGLPVEALDIERLALALRVVTRGTWSTPTRRSSEAQQQQDEAWLRTTAEKVAREYAALASPATSQGTGEEER